MHRARRALAPGIVGLSLVAPAAAHASWGPAVPVTGTGQDAYALGVAANAHDRPAVLFQTRARGGEWTLALRRTGSAGRLGRGTVLVRSRHSVGGGGVFAGRGSDLVAGWLQIINGSRRPVVATGPRLEHRQVLAPGPRSTQILRLAANRRGDAVVAFWRYTRSSFSIFAAMRPAGGRFGKAQRIVTGSASFSSVAIDQAGNAVVGWTEPDGVHVAIRRAGAAAFDPSVLVAADRHLRGDPGLALEGDHVVVSWMAEDIDGNRTLLVSERASAGAAFTVPRALTRPGVGLPRWLTPSLAVKDGRTFAAWVQGSRFTTARDAAALAVKQANGPWGEPFLRGIPGPARVYSVDLLAPAPGRPALLGLTTALKWNFRVATSTLRAGGRLGALRVPAAGRAGGFRPYMAQGRRHTWLVTERNVGHDRLQRRQVLLFKSNQ